MRDTERALDGFGIGLRTKHYHDLLAEPEPVVDWLEILSENYFVAGGSPLYYLDQFAERYPMAMHGVSMSLGSTDPVDFQYLAKLDTLAKRVDAVVISDHLCWTGVGGVNAHDLLPLPLTEDALANMIAKVGQVQDYLGRSIAIENPSSYLSFAGDCLSEWDFLVALVQETGCQLLLDVNNVYVSASNHGYEAEQFISALPSDSIAQIHLAGHSQGEHCLIDTHDAPVPPAVLKLYQFTLQRHGFKPTMIERDANIPELSVLLNELEQVRAWR